MKFVGSVVKNLPAKAGDWGSIPGSGRSPEEGNGNPLQYSCLENPMDRGAWWTLVHGLARVRQDLATKKQEQFSSVAQLCPTLCDPVDCSTPGFPVHHQLPELAQTHVHWVSNAIQPSHPLSPSPPARRRNNRVRYHFMVMYVLSSYPVTQK